MTEVLTPPPPSDYIGFGGKPLAPPANALTVTDYARKIHWWVRLFGVIWLVSMAIAVVVGIAAGTAMSSNHTTSSVFSSRSQCMQASYTTTQECNLLFPN
jgi:hypothetical protein